MQQPLLHIRNDLRIEILSRRDEKAKSKKY